MAKRHLFLLLIVLSLLLCHVFIIGGYGCTTIQLTQLMADPKDIQGKTIVAGDTFINLFIWKDLQIYSLNDLFNSTHNKSQVLKFFSFDNLNTKNMQQILRMINNEFPIPFNNNSFKFTQIQFGRNTECLFGSAFEMFDIMIGTSIEFSERIRLNRNHRKYRKKEGNDVLNPNDFYIIPLFPTRFYVIDEKCLVNNHVSLTQVLYDKLVNVSNEDLNQFLTCKQSIEHDHSLIERLHGSLFMTNQEFSRSIQYFNLTNVNYNSSFISEACQQVENLFLTNSEISTLLWKSTCFNCDSFSCVSERWKWPDTLDMIIVSLGIVYYFILFASGAFKSPVVYKKYGIIFLGPLLNMGEFISTLNAFNNTCVTMGVIFSNLMACLMTLIYIFTVLRYFYLRNLYHFVKNSKHSKFLKFLAGDGFGFLFTIIFPIPLSVLFLIPILILIPSYNLPIINTTNNAIIIVLCVFSCLAGITFLIFDVLKNRNVISKFGFRRFFIFEDPYYFRIDLLSLIVILLILIVTAIVFAIEPLGVPALRFCIGLAVYMVVGGTSMIFLLVERVKSSMNKKDQYYDRMDRYDIFIDMIKNNVNEDLSQLFNTYCTKSFALENLMFIEKVMECKRKSENISLEILRKIQEKYLIPYSTYEVNIPSHARDNFIHNLEKGILQQNENFKINLQILDEIMLEVEKNLKSTFNRFERTSEFLEWREIFALQQEKSAIKPIPLQL